MAQPTELSGAKPKAERARMDAKPNRAPPVLLAGWVAGEQKIPACVLLSADTTARRVMMVKHSTLPDHFRRHEVVNVLKKCLPPPVENGSDGTRTALCHRGREGSARLPSAGSRRPHYVAIGSQRAAIDLASCLRLRHPTGH